MDSKKYKIFDKELSIAKTTLKDYKKINLLLKEVGGLNIDISTDQKLMIGVGTIINNLLDNNLVEKFLSIILGSDDLDLLGEIEDATLVEVVTDFFYSKKELIENITGSFKRLKKNTIEPTQSSNG